MSYRRAFTLVELVVVLVMVGIMLCLLAPSFGAADSQPTTQATQPDVLGSARMLSSIQLRGIHQCMVIYAQSNNFYLPGVDPNGRLVLDGPATGFSGNGATTAGRFYPLVYGGFISSNILVSPMEKRATWTTGKVTKAHYSYAMLQIANSVKDSGRLAEWKDNANSQAALLSDRNTGKDNSDEQVQSLWRQEPGRWAGGVVWGDNHADFAKSHTDFSTRYHATPNRGDNLFAIEPSEKPLVTEGAKDPVANAMLAWE